MKFAYIWFSESQLDFMREHLYEVRGELARKSIEETDRLQKKILRSKERKYKKWYDKIVRAKMYLFVGKETETTKDYDSEGKDAI